MARSVNQRFYCRYQRHFLRVVQPTLPGAIAAALYHASMEPRVTVARNLPRGSAVLKSCAERISCIITELYHAMWMITQVRHQRYERDFLYEVLFGVMPVFVHRGTKIRR